ncbi:MAG TPA: twin-arginine translocase subunit TatC [Candidatus Binatia bacterium]|nr:twin-arginine translocase subunit TatC [Candidatus Binatia bacterium]
MTVAQEPGAAPEPEPAGDSEPVRDLEPVRDIESVRDPEPLPAATMPLSGHLAELRDRVIWSLLAIGAGGSVGFMLGDPIVDFLTAPIPPDVPVIVTQIGAAFSIRLQIALVVGVILAMPVILWHVWRFIAPGLTPSERRAVLPWIPMALMFFALGVVVAYLVMPSAASFLLTFLTDRVTPMLDLGAYMDFMSTLFLAFGIVMELPILLIGLSRVGIVTSDRLRRSRGIVLIVIFIFAAVATPGGDIVSPTVLAGVLYLLFEGTIVFIRRSGR